MACPDGAWEVSAVITTPVITHLLAAKWKRGVGESGIQCSWLPASKISLFNWRIIYIYCDGFLPYSHIKLPAVSPPLSPSTPSTPLSPSGGWELVYTELSMMASCTGWSFSLCKTGMTNSTLWCPLWSSDEVTRLEHLA